MSLPTVSAADDWLNLRGPAPAALSVPSKSSSVAEYWRPRASRPVTRAQPQMEKLKWKVLLYAGEAQNCPPRPTTGETQPQPFWSTSSLHVGPTTSARRTMQQGVAPRPQPPSPRSTQHPAQPPQPLLQGVSGQRAQQATRRPNDAPSAKQPQPPSPRSGGGGKGSLAPQRQTSSMVASSSPPSRVVRGCGLRQSTTSHTIVPTTAVFSKQRGIFLHDTLPAALQSSVSTSAFENGKDRSEEGGTAGARADMEDVHRGGVPPPPTAAADATAPQVVLRPNSAPSARDIQSIKRLIRLVQVETGETQFRQSLDSRVLQSLIPTATMHRATHTNNDALRGRGSDSGGGASSPASAKRLRRTGATTSGQQSQSQEQEQHPTSTAQKANAAAAELTTSLIGPTPNGNDLALGRCTAQGVDCTAQGGESPARHPHPSRHDEASHHCTVDRASPPRRDDGTTQRPRPTSARVMRPAFTYQRTFDGHMTLEHWQQGASGGPMQSPRFLQFSADTIPVVGRR